MRILLWVTACSAIATSSLASAQSCPAYQGQTVSPMTFDQVASRFSRALSPKSEFETTATYEARLRAIVGADADHEFIIGKTADPQYIKYDADQQVLTLQSYLFDNININYDVMSDLPGSLAGGAMSNTDVVIEQSDNVAGSYSGSNAYGASTRVARISRVTKGIFDHWGQRASGSGLFANDDPNWLHFPLSSEKASALKPHLRIAFVVVPRPPYVVRGVGSSGRTTINHPIDTQEQVTLLTGDIRCALVLMDTGTVLGSLPTL